MKKNINLFHLLEEFALYALLLFFLLFMKKGEDSFFAITFGFSTFAFLFLMLMIYIDGDKSDRGMCKLLPIARSDLAFYAMLIQYALAVGFTVWHNLGSVNIPSLAVIYALFPIIELLIVFMPAPKEAPPPAPANEGGEIKQKSLDYYVTVLRTLVKKCEFESLSLQMEKLADLLCRIDPEFSVQLHALEDDISHKCVKIENALLTQNTAQQALLERELSATVELIEKRVAGYKYCLKDEGFYRTDDELAMQQIDLLLDKFSLEYEEDLPTLDTPFENEFFYRKALRFASEEYASLLASYNRQIVEKIEKKAAEKADRKQKNESALQKVGHAACLLIFAAIAGLLLYWHFVFQPSGFILSENDDGTFSVAGYNSFYGHELTVPEKIGDKQITSIGREALMGSSITKLTLSEGIKTIEYQAIKNCKSLEALILPESLTTIGHYAFAHDESLTEVYYRGSEEAWQKVEIGINGNDVFESVEVEFNYAK